MNTLSRLAGACALAATAAVGLCAPTQAGSADGAAEDRLYGASSPFLSHELPTGMLRDDLGGLAGPSLERALRWLHRFDFPARDVASLRVTADGDVLYADPPPDRGDKALAAAAHLATLDPVPFLQLAAETPFELHSRPGARHTAYIDFDGHFIRNTAWNAASGIKGYTARPFDLDGDPNTFNDDERYAIAMIWHRVAEDYAPFDINVTTEAPGAAGPEVGHVVVTSHKSAEGHLMPFHQSGGVAYVGTWARNDAAYYSPILVYFDNLWRDVTMIAESVAHELGHAVGLSHDGTNLEEYYSGHGDGDISWAPIMGRSYYKNVTQWSRGEYAFANNPQDDIAIIESVLGLVPDDHGNTPAFATPLLIEDGQVSVSDPETDPYNEKPDNKGVIGTTDDVDFFAFDTGGRVRLLAQPAWKAFEYPDARGANLDLMLRLIDADGREVARSNPWQGTHALIDADLDAGTYYLAVSGVGSSNYSRYGSLGQYFISGTVEPPRANQLPDAGFGFACVDLDCGFTDLSSDPDGQIVAWQWDFGDGHFSDQPNSRHRYSGGGNYRVTLTVTDDDNGSATAAQTVRVAGRSRQFELIVDDTSPDTTHTGRWNLSFGKGPWGGGSVYNDDNRVFQWSPTVPVAGTYAVYAWWTYHDNRSERVPYKVEHASGTTTVVVDQRDPSLASQWVPLGTYEFAAGPAIVTVSSENGQANADAIRLVSTTDLPVDDRPPDIAFSTPADGARVQGVVALHVDAHDDAAVERVEFLVDGELVGLASRFPYTVDWDSRQASDGMCGVEAIAFDINGNSRSADITLLVENGTAPFEVIIDDADEATARDGAWNASAAPSAWQVGSVYSNANGKFHWLPVLPGRGHYEVAAWWTHHPNRSAEVPYRIVHADGATVVGMDQSDPAKAGRWVPLGTFEFAGGPTTVTVSSENGQASADAIRLRAIDKPADDTRAPEISIISPADGARVGSQVEVLVEASDDVGVLRVQFLVEGVVVSEDRTAPYAAELDLGGAGGTDVILTARAYDAAGNVAAHSVTVMREQPGARLATIVDNRSVDTESTGRWGISTGSRPWDTDSLFSNADGTFGWLPELGNAGRYEVFAWWTHHPNRSEQVPYRVTHRHGSSEILVDQRDPLNASQWVSLGVFDFDSGVAPVEVSSENGQASADAVMFVLH
jgi:PKD repeat protein